MLIDFYGLIIKCKTDSEDLTAELLRPYRHFLKAAPSSEKQSLTIVAEEKAPPYKDFPSLASSFSTPRNIVYKSKELKIVDYFGKAAVVEDMNTSVHTIYSADRGLLSEIFYLLVLSLIGRFCDKNDILRLHALGLSHGEKAFVILMPPGSGKSTIALSLIKEPDIKLISDDEPLFNGSGSIAPFPLRIGALVKERIGNVPDKYVYKVDRMEFGPKYFVDYDYYKEKVEDRFLKDVTLISGKRTLNCEPGIKNISKMKMFKTLLRDAVVGVGLFQGVEFIFNSSQSEIFSKIPVLFKRLFLAIRLVSSARTYELTISSDIEQNARVITDFMRN